ncbi:MAG: hypothetical protein ACLSB7_04865 [Parabacteroides distasonis]
MPLHGRKIAWLKRRPAIERVPYSSNVRCLSKGGCAGFGRCSFVAARNSEVDVVQSVGRVMRTFTRGYG